MQPKWTDEGKQSVSLQQDSKNMAQSIRMKEPFNQMAADKGMGTNLKTR